MIRLPNINGATQQEQLAQMRSYLYQLVGELQFALGSVENGTAQVISKVAAPSAVSQEQQAQEHFNEVKSLIIKSADIINSYYVEIDSLLRLSGYYAAQSDFGSFKEETNTAISASNDRITSVADRTETLETDVTAVKTAQTTVLQTADALKIQVEGLLDNGVQRIVTAKGFTFDEKGLTISDPANLFTTVVDEQGMRVRYNGSDVLVADSEGVTAKNLHASTYLIIGKEKGRSRFEDYGTDRTGCFWIGG